MESELEKVLNNQRDFFKTLQTLDIDYRKQALKRLKLQIKKREKDIIDALYKDFKKPEFETILSETGIVLKELDYAIKNIASWAKPKRVFPSLLNFPSVDYITKEPYGACLIIAPWNYPFQLAISPLIGAVAAGNTAVVKPSELAPYTSAIVAQIIEEAFNAEHVCVVEGGVEVSQELLSLKWDYIFFTGSVQVGKIVAKAAAQHLTPFTLELGGKNPCIIDNTANIKLAAKRIVWGKFINAGQTCIAPDYILIHKSSKAGFIEAVKQEIKEAYGENPEQSPDYPRIINKKHFNRLSSMLSGMKILVGGQTNETDNYIAPTLLDEPDLDSAVMQDEIFGPILPVLTYTTMADIHKIITRYHKPLSLYVFSNNRLFTHKITTYYSFGGGAVNDTVVQFANNKLPFGGVGHSGIGAYHGKASFTTFTHQKPIVKRGTWLDIPIRYAPYKKKKKVLQFFLNYFK